MLVNHILFPRSSITQSKNNKRHFSFGKTLFLATILGLLLKTEKAYSIEYTVTIRGSFFGYDGSTNSEFPLKGARVMLMNSNANGSTIFDDVMGLSYINADGSFIVTGKGGDMVWPWPWSKPDVYIRIVYNNDKGVRLTNELDWDRYFDTPQHDHNNFEGELDIGRWIIGHDVGIGNASKCGVWMAACNAWDEYVEIMGETPPSGKFDVEYWSGVWSGTPWTNDNTTHWPIHYSTSIMRHEFGHLIRHAFDGNRNHFNWDVTRFRYARFHNPCNAGCDMISTDTHVMGLAYGFNEGWADYWSDKDFNCPISEKFECEAKNTIALRDLANSYAMGKRDMVNILKNHPGQIHSFDEFANFLISGISRSLSMIKRTNNPGKMVKTLGTPKTITQSINDRVIASGAQIKEAKAILNDLERQIHIANDLATGARDCDSNDCYIKYNRLIRPIVLKAEYSIKKLELERMEQGMSNGYRKYYMKMMGNGSLDTFFINQKKKYNQKIYQINLDAYNKVLEVIKKFIQNNKTAEVLQKEIELKLSEFKKKESIGKLPFIALPQFIFKEDLARIKDY